MNILLQNGLPFEIDGVGISPDFRNMIAFELIMRDEELDDMEKTILALEQLFPDVPHNINKAIRGLMWFYNRGQEPEEATEGGKGGSIQAYDFDQDASHIFAAFYSAYGICLTTVPFLHWWEFVALFEGLPEDTLIKRIMHYRTVNIQKVPKHEKKHYEEMKRIYALKQHKGEKASLEELERQTLQNAEDRFAAAERQAEKGGANGR